MFGIRQFAFPAVLDGIDNRTERAYTAGPDRLYLIGQDGRVIFKMRPSPSGFSAKSLEEVLRKLEGEKTGAQGPPLTERAPVRGRMRGQMSAVKTPSLLLLAAVSAFAQNTVTVRVNAAQPQDRSLRSMLSSVMTSREVWP